MWSTSNVTRIPSYIHSSAIDLKEKKSVHTSSYKLNKNIASEIASQFEKQSHGTPMFKFKVENVDEDNTYDRELQQINDYSEANTQNLGFRK